jgi:hypothetical protein
MPAERPQPLCEQLPIDRSAPDCDERHEALGLQRNMSYPTVHHEPEATEELDACCSLHRSPTPF